MILENYLWTGQGFFSENEITQIHACADRLDYHIQMVGQSNSLDPDGKVDTDGTVNEELRQGQVKWFVNEESTMPQPIIDKLYNALELSMAESNWNFKIDYNENIQYTVYEAQPEKRTGDFYTWHTDSGPLVYDNGMMRKMSMTIQLSDPDEYEGGHFQWLEPYEQFNRLTKNDTVIDMDSSIRTIPFSAKQKGSVVAFPSFVYHQVTPVTKGTRKSLVVWFCGKPYV